MIVDRDVLLDPDRLDALVAAEGVTTLFVTTALFNRLAGHRVLGRLRTVLFGGEAVDVGAVRRVLAGPRPERLVHVYGPTETTTFATWWLVGDVPPDAVTVPIGRAVANTSVYVVDGRDRLCPPGVPGELWIGGPKVAWGYLGRPALTARQFVPDPFSGDPGARLYRSGDRVRQRPDGAIEFLGRLDNQVKVRGFRIEPGEIEAHLTAHAAVAAAAVVAHDTRLTAYVVPDAEWRVADLTGELVDTWGRVFDGIYAAAPAADPAFDTSGWLSSYTGDPIPAAEMQAWVDATVARVAALRPRRILEIGCGTGLLLWRLAPGCERYVGTDVSAEAVAALHEELVRRPVAGVELQRAAAHDLAGIDGEFDLVILNSVVQYFPDQRYLERVLDDAVGRLVPGGHVFVGDVRSLALLDAFDASVELAQAHAATPLREIRERVERRRASDSELVVDPALFVALARRDARVVHVDVMPKATADGNEMTRYRYDVVVHRGPHVAAVAPVWTRWSDVDAVARLLDAPPAEVFGVRGVPNVRVAADVHAAERLAEGRAGTAGALVGAPADGVDPAEIVAAARDRGWDATLSWADTDGRGAFDVVFSRAPVLVAWPGARPAPAALTKATEPFRRRVEQELAATLAQHLRTVLPDYMVPSAYVVIDRLPLTPNGKVDRAALPPPPSERARVGGAYVAPRTALEVALARVWASVLGLDEVGAEDNFFDLGGDSIISLQVVARAGEAGVDVSTEDVFRHQTVAALAAAVAARGPREVDTTLPDGRLPLGPIQSWFFETTGGASHFNQALLFDAPADLDFAALERAVAAVVERHPALRLRFGRDGDSWYQEHGDAAGSFACTRVEVGGEAGAITAAAAAEQRLLDIEHGPLLRVAWLDRGAEREGRLLVVAHHLVVDGVSWRILLGDLATAYAGGSIAGEGTPFARWVTRLTDHAASGGFDADAPYWHTHTHTHTRSGGDFPPKLPAKHRQNRLADEVTVTLAVPSVHGTRIDEVLVAALAVALGGNVVIDLEGHGREPVFDDVDLSRTVGWFTSMFPVALDVDVAGGPGAWLDAIKEQLRAVPGRGVPYGVLRYLRGGGVPARSRPAVGFNYLGQFDVAPGTPFLRAAAESPGPTAADDVPRPHPLDVNALVAEGRLHVTFTATHELGTIAEDFVDALERIVAHSETLDDVYPLSPLQRGILYHSLARPSAYVEQAAVRLRGPLDLEAMRQAWQDVTDRHAVLRTALDWKNLREPRQVVRRGVDAVVRVVEGSTVAADERAAGFALDTAPLSRVALVPLGPDEHRMVWTFHHVILDGWSLPIVLGDVLTAYAARRGGTAPAFAPTLPYRELIAWLQQQDPHTADEYWREALAGLPDPVALALPARAAPADEEGRLDTAVPADVAAAMVELARANRLTVNTVVQAAWAMTLAHATGRDDVVFGATSAGRPPALPGVEQAVGLYINTVPVRVRLDPAEPVLDLLHRIQDDAVRRRPYEHVALSRVRAAGGVRGSAPLFDTVLAYENYPATDSAAAPTGLIVEADDDARVAERTDLPLAVAVFPEDGLRISWHFDRRRFDERSIQSLAATFTTMCTTIVTVPHAATPPPTPVLSVKVADTWPISPTEPAVVETLAAIWCAVLGRERVGMDEDFFELGGDSLQAMDVAARAADAGLDVTAPMVLAHPTVAELAARSTPRVARRETTAGPVPLTPIQRWFFELDLAEPHHFNQSMVFEVPPDADPGMLEAAAHAVVARHDALRLRFDGTLHATVAPDERGSLFTDAIDLMHGPLLRLDRAGSKLTVAVHHLAVDTVSWSIIERDLATAISGRSLAPPPPSFAEWARRLEQWAPTAEREAAFWLEQASAGPALVADDPDGDSTAGAERVVARALPGQPTDDVVLTALTDALARRTAGPFGVHVERHGREAIFDDLDVSGTVGWFTTMFPLAGPLSAVPRNGIGYGVLRYLTTGATADALAAAPAPVVSFNYLGRRRGVATGDDLGPQHGARNRRPHLLDVVAAIVDGRLELALFHDGRLRPATVEALADDVVDALSPRRGGLHAQRSRRRRR